MSVRNSGKIRFFTAAVIFALACVAWLVGPRTTSAQQGELQGEAAAAARARGKVSQVPSKPLDWPLPPGVDKSYATIDGHKLHGYVEQLAAISEKYRDAGNQWWGRIPGMPSGIEAQEWAVQKFKDIGVPTETIDLADPQDLPKSWDVSMAGNGKTLHLTSSDPIIDFTRFAPTMKGDVTLDTVWVGLGQPADYIGKDVKGKAVVIYSIPTPSDLVQSAMWMESVGRAQKAGAAAIIIDIAIWGSNMQYVSHMEGGRVNDIKVPMFTIGDKDGHEVEELVAGTNGTGVKTHLVWQNEHYPDLHEKLVIGKLDGMTNESIVMIAHIDGYFDGALDDGAGSAGLLGVAEYFAKMPKEKRRRTMYFVSMPDHHGGDYGGKWMHQNLHTHFGNVVVTANAEHFAATNPVIDRAWFTNDEPHLVASNGSGPSWWGVYGSDRLAHTVVDDFATFGVPTQTIGGGSAGQLAQMEYDGTSFYLHNKGVYYHCSEDTPDKVPESTLKNATQAFAKIFNDINKMEAKDLEPPASSRPGASQSSALTK